MSVSIDPVERLRFGQFLRLALPMIASRAGLATMGVADAIMVSRFDPAVFAQLSLAEGTVGRLLDIFVAFLIGGLSLVPRFFGKGDASGAYAVWRRSLPFVAVLGIAGILAGFYCGRFLGLVGQPADLSGGAAPLAVILGFGFPGALLAITIALYLEGTGRPTIVAVAVISANLLNILLNWLLINGHGGFPVLGAEGSAIATTTVRWALAGAFVLYLVAHRAKRGAPTEPSVEFVASARTQWQLGLSSAATVATLVTLGSSLTIFAGWLGTPSLAVYSATMSMAALVALMALGLADATGVSVATVAGRAGDGQTGPTAWAGLRMTLLPVGILCAGMALLAPALVPIYGADTAMRLGMISFIPITLLSVFVDTTGFVMAASLRALRDVLWPAIIQIGSMALLAGLAWVLVFGNDFGTWGLFVAMLTCSCSRALFLTIRFRWCLRGSPTAVIPEGSAG